MVKTGKNIIGYSEANAKGILDGSLTLKFLS